MLDKVVVGGVTDDARGLFRQAADTLVAAHASRQFPWTPFNVSPISSEEAIQRGMGALDGFLPASYGGDRGRGGADVDGDVVTTDPKLVREYYLRDCVCNVIVEGFCVPGELSFPPVHNVTWCLGRSLYKHSAKFEDVLCGEIYSRSSRAPYDIHLGDQLVDPDLAKELTAEIDRIMPAESQLWAAEAYRNLALLLRYVSQNDGYRIMACYF